MNIIFSIFVIYFVMASVHTVMAYNNRMLLKSLNIRPAVSRIVHSPREILRLYSVADLPSADVLVSTAFNIANFGPQPFWLLMILFPTSEITKAFMKPWTTVIFFVLVHFFIVVTSITQPDGSAPIAEFAKVFDPAGDPLRGMIGMMQYRNFVAEEWSHVLTWDLLVGRLIWQDGLDRGIFTSHSVLLTNLIGPPGLLLHALTCQIFYHGKSLPGSSLYEGNAKSNKIQNLSENSIVKNKKTAFTAGNAVSTLFPNMLSSSSSRNAILDACSNNVVWEYTHDGTNAKGRLDVESMLIRRSKNFPSTASYNLERVADGLRASGFCWSLTQSGVEGKGLRGVTYVEFDNNGKIVYVRECAEPLFKPGSATSGLLKAIVSDAVKKDPTLAIRPSAPPKRKISDASDLVTFLWREVNGSDKELVLSCFDEDIVYEDFNFSQPFSGKDEVKKFIDEFDIPGVKFIPERIGDGKTACAFTWRVELAGVIGNAVRGVSFYATDSTGEKVTYICDCPEPAIKPAPLQELASLVRPGLRKF